MSQFRRQICLLLFLNLCVINSFGILYPRDSETRETKSLDGIWQFITAGGSAVDEGFTNKWFDSPVSLMERSIPMPVPSSYNDITQDKNIRDYVGWVWYRTTFFAPSCWQNKNRVFLRFGSVHYTAIVYLNTVKVISHRGGHLPFEADVTDHLRFTEMNNLVVAVNNTLNNFTIPSAEYIFYNDTEMYPPNYYEMKGVFDFFNYAGIQRSVTLYAVPRVYVSDVIIRTDIIGNRGIVTYQVFYGGKAESAPQCVVTIYDKTDRVVSTNGGLTATVNLDNAHFWWPYTMSNDPGYMYTMKILLSTSGNLKDVYYQKFGIRTVRVMDKQFLINGKSLYFRGFGKHEDYDIRGRALDLPLVIKDINLIKWSNANSFRTSHYPYSEEMMDLCDEQGIMVIDEAPAVQIGNFHEIIFKLHLQIMEDLVQRDKNHPSVIMWSLGNECSTMNHNADKYFKQLVDYTRDLDPTRPITLVLNSKWDKDLVAGFLDVISVNQYSAWYSNTGKIEVIAKQVKNELQNWYGHFKKPILVTEYGADTVVGLHSDPSFVFTEEYQVDFLVEYHKVFDQIRYDFLIGEMVWNFADFMTQQDYHRVMGNKKGIFTRQRQPKMAAHLLRQRYRNLAIEAGTSDDFAMKDSFSYNCPKVTGKNGVYPSGNFNSLKNKIY